MKKFCFLKETIILVILAIFSNHTFSAEKPSFESPMHEIKKEIEDLQGQLNSKISDLMIEASKIEEIKIAEAQTQASPNHSIPIFNNITGLVLNDFNKNTDLSIFPFLTKLTLDCSSYSGTGKKKCPILNMPVGNLVYLNISGHSIEAEARFKEIAKLTALETLIMTNCSVRDNLWFVRLKSLKKLKTLDVLHIEPSPNAAIQSLIEELNKISGHTEKLQVIN